jgi:hypothetical protein
MANITTVEEALAAVKEDGMALQFLELWFTINRW